MWIEAVRLRPSNPRCRGEFAAAATSVVLGGLRGSPGEITQLAREFREE